MHIICSQERNRLRKRWEQLVYLPFASASGCACMAFSAQHTYWRHYFVTVFWHPYNTKAELPDFQAQFS